MQAKLPTPKALSNTAQGRAAHPGKTTHAPRPGTLKGFYKAFGVKNSRAYRTGVTVLEVLIAIGVASVGLLGVILLIPLADHQMNEGAKLERANQVGASAFRAFQTRWMNNPGNWIQYTGGTPPLVRPSLYASDGDPVNNPPGGPFNDYRRAFCIDPRFVAANGAVLGPSNEDPRVFPYTVDATVTILTMPRITLPTVSGGTTPMGLLQADSVFVALDDLEFRRPTDDRTLPPVQLNNAGGADDNDNDGDIDGDWNPLDANPQPGERARKAFGRLSWMAMLVPNEKLGANGDEYILSVVVFYDRDPSFTMVLPNESNNERVAQIPVTGSYNGFFAGGVGGGDVALMPRNTGLSQTAAENELDVRTGDWVMLSRRNTYTLRRADGTPVLDDSDNPIELEGPQSHRWYRVLSADSELIASNDVANAPPNSWIRFATLEGPDWPADSNTQVTLVQDVIAVFEKTVRLDASSLWTD